MALRARLEKLKARQSIKVAWINPAQRDTLDRLAARKVAGCATVQRELDALVAALEGGDNGNAARAT